jgi:glycosyltransferase involved in cell wall biosynthesis
MRILIINHYAGSPGHGMDFRPYYFAREWVKNGHAVKIVAASYSHLRYRQPQSADDNFKEIIDGIEYDWLKTPAYHGNGARRVINIFVFLYRLLKYQHQITTQFKPDAVIAASTYPFDNITAHSIARRHQAKHIFEVHDLWPLSLIELGGMSKWHPFVLLVGWAERYAYKKTDIVLCTLPKAEPHMRTRGLAAYKFRWIPNGIDVAPDLHAPPSLPNMHRTLLTELKKNTTIIGYAGGHAVSNALETLVRSAVYIPDLPVSIVLAGDGAEKEKLQQLTVDLALQNVFFLPPVPKECVQQLLSFMDVMYIGWQRKAIYRYGVSSTKLMDYMLSSKPVIHSNDVANDIVAESGCGISIPPEDPIALGEAIRTMTSITPESRNAMGMKGKAYVILNHNNKDIAQKVLDCCAAAPANYYRSPL